MTNVPAESKSPSPEALRIFAQHNSVLKVDGLRELLVTAASEIEGSEAAYGDLVDELHRLRSKLAHTEQNLRSMTELAHQLSSSNRLDTV